ncbi:hypothetical protein QBC42DRAFT_177730 [Cladorrhinum samala]|uniref:Putative gamma-glutamylcyclotransferase n=1 Tax=Cladorrhinum samala TaxID=585594 RepID=A0AAV9HM15_9PEZI|nr:hypothetical protein QBC42DRAFT_177730 [Cladorrhinum samala]
MPNPNPSSTPARPLFIYGTLLSPRLLSVVLTGTSANAQLVLPLLAPASVEGFARRALNHKDYPAAVPSAGSRMHGYLLSPLTRSQRKKLDNFEGETYEPTSVTVHTVQGNSNSNTAADVTLLLPRPVQADIYIWRGDPDQVSQLPWDFELFEKERLDDWLDIFEEMPDMAGDSDQEE